MPDASASITTVSQRDLARLFGVSQVTVSRALRGTGEVEPKLEVALREAARKHGYSSEAHFNARALIQRRHGREVTTNVICAMVYDAGESANHFNMRVLRGIENGAKGAGNDLLIAPNVRSGVFPRVVARRQVDGVVWLLPDIDFRFRELSCPVPLVTILFAAPGADLVAVNDHEAMAAMGAHLAGLGHRRVAFVGPDSTLARARRDGLRAGLSGSGVAVDDDHVRMKKYAMNRDTTLPLVRDLMDRRRTEPEAQRFTAIAVYNDYMAATVIQCLQAEYGLCVPRDLSVTGFDGVEIPGSAIPKLTTAAIPLEELGAEAARMIAWRMRHPKGPRRQKTVEAQLVPGETTGRIEGREG